MDAKAVDSAMQRSQSRSRAIAAFAPIIQIDILRSFQTNPSTRRLELGNGWPLPRESYMPRSPLIELQDANHDTYVVLEELGDCSGHAWRESDDEGISPRDADARPPGRSLRYLRRQMFENERACLNKIEGPTFSDAAWNITTRFIDKVGRGTIGRSFEDLMAFGLPTIKKFKDDKSICLTFDDGPNPRTLYDLLSELRKQQVRATFFCVGRQIAQNPSLAKAICEDGHEIANHTMSHVDLYRVSPATSLREIALCQDAIESVCGVCAQSFRAPWGHFRPDQIRAKRFGIKHFAKWDIAPEWSLTDPHAIARHILSSVGGGSVVLLHDWLADRQPELAEAVGLAAAKSIDLFVPKLKDLGHSFRTLSEQAAMSSAVTHIKLG